MTGLERVHVIMRLVSSERCDPLELATSTEAGVPGLVEACRRGTVTLANPLGSGIGESTALLHFLPELTRTLLGEDPLIEAAPTWWCANDQHRRHVLANLDRLLIRSSGGGSGRRTLFGRMLSSDERALLASEIEAAPHRFVGQQEVEFEPQAVFDGDRLTHAPVVTRAYLVAGNSGFEAMPGGLSITATTTDAITFDAPVRVKDTWVYEAEGVASDMNPRQVVVAATRQPPVDLRDSITSRAAASMYWIGRNLERALTTVRLIRSVALLHESRHDLWSDTSPMVDAGIDLLIDSIVGAAPNPSFVGDGRGRLTNEVLPAALTDSGRPRSLASSLYYLLSNVESVRQLFSADSWRALQRITERYRSLLNDGNVSTTQDALDTFSPLLELSALIAESMVRDPGWWFLDLGRRVEGAQLATGSIGATLQRDPPEEIAASVWNALLGTWDGVFAYRRRYRSDVDPSLLIDLLLCDTSNPHSVCGNLAGLTRALDHLHSLRGAGPNRSPAAQQCAALLESLQGANVEALAAVGADRTRRSLSEFTTGLTTAIDAVAEDIDLTYFVQLSSRHLEGSRLPTEAAGVASVGQASA